VRMKYSIDKIRGSLEPSGLRFVGIRPDTPQ
jgi:hypothetical protein